MTRDQVVDIAVGFVIAAAALLFLEFIGWMLTKDYPPMPRGEQAIESEQ